MPNYGAGSLSRFSDAVDGDLPDPAMGKDVILAACDGNYFNLFAVDLIGSMERLGVRQALHIHLLEPPKSVIAAAEKLRASLKWVRLTVTIDRCELAAGLQHRQVYYTAARFLVAPLILDRGIERLLVIDVDAVMNKSPWDMFTSSSRLCDGGFIFRPQKKRPWYRVLASAVFYSADAGSRRLASAIARSLTSTLLLKPSYHIDQLIPYYACSFAPDYNEAFKVFDMPPEVMGYNYEAEASFWTVKGKSDIEKFISEKKVLLDT
ncbi:hypothetical protein J5289_20885 [Rhizobium sp. B230/85]|nr:hypothetical protein [Rhizobium sp. B209b/85]QXZ98971.1 hypothetical protein J5289_20885 [Rhizobium sp. B230/85]